jgi:metal-dependent amidase/aminoacylase/carboxypeptidase family protein
MDALPVLEQTGLAYASTVRATDGDGRQVPLMHAWLLGGTDPSAFAQAQGFEDIERIARSLPSNHSPLFAPVIEPTLETGAATLISAARNWLPAPV